MHDCEFELSATQEASLVLVLILVLDLSLPIEEGSIATSLDIVERDLNQSNYIGHLSDNMS